MDKTFYTFIVFIFGTLIGSFLNVCIYRIPNQRSVVFPGSHCYSCGTFLKALDLIPFFSHLRTGGLCRYCGSVIGFRYSMVELLTGSLFALFFYKFYFSMYTLLAFIVLSFAIIISFIDLDYLIIPDGISLGSIVTGFFLNILFFIFASAHVKEALNYHLTFTDPVLGMLAGGGTLLFISFISGGGMGGGDIKLMAGIGAIFGLKFTLVTIFLSFILGAIIGILLILFRIVGRKEYIPFGPYIALACIITLYAGSDNVLRFFQEVLWSISAGI